MSRYLASWRVVRARERAGIEGTPQCCKLTHSNAPMPSQCCNGDWPCSGRCNEQSCPECCLATETVLCFAQSVASTRWMVQDEMHLRNTQCDNCIIGTMIGAGPAGGELHHVCALPPLLQMLLVPAQLPRASPPRCHPSPAAAQYLACICSVSEDCGFERGGGWRSHFFVVPSPHTSHPLHEPLRRTRRDPQIAACISGSNELAELANLTDLVADFLWCS